MSQQDLSRWIRDLDRYLPMKTLFLLHGNIYDQLLYPDSRGPGTPDQWSYYPLRPLLQRFFADRGYRATAFYDQVDGLTLLSDEERSAFKEATSSWSGRPTIGGREPPSGQEDKSSHSSDGLRTIGLEHLRDIDSVLDAMRVALAKNPFPLALVLDYASRLITSPAHLAQRERHRFVKILKASQEASRKARGAAGNHVMILVCNRLNDLPAWLYLDNPLAKPLQIPLPQPVERRRYFEMAAVGFHGAAGLRPQELEMVIDAFVDLSHGLSSYELESLRLVSRRESIPFSEPRTIIERYKFGVKESPWEALARGRGRDRLVKAEVTLSQRVKGQEGAVRAVVGIIKRAASGLSGIHHSASAHKPKGVLFFAGPTGVGKTEMAKALAELLFGDESACVRFDMSEYAQEHSDQRLLGAPPGYVGYEEGGQLTNRLKDSPFAVLLFDEIEKAHPKIMDKFLQILEDGRMTDGKGETVYFSESVIIFTSNIGAHVDVPVAGSRVVRRPNILPYSWRCADCGEMAVEEQPPARCARCSDERLDRVETPYDLIKERISKALEEHFKMKLGRPEIYNRIGNNFVIFDYIRANAAEQIMAKILSNIAGELKEKRNLSLTFAQAATQVLLECAAANVDQGGRGIGNLIESAVVNPLARTVFDQDLRDVAILVRNVVPDHEGDAGTFWLETEVGRHGKENGA